MRAWGGRQTNRAAAGWPTPRQLAPGPLRPLAPVALPCASLDRRDRPLRNTESLGKPSLAAMQRLPVVCQRSALSAPYQNHVRLPAEQHAPVS